MKLFRVQHKTDAASMWYNPDGTPNRIVDKLTSKRLAQLPMDYDPRYRESGKRWQCACDSIEQLNAWFTLQDFQELQDMGYIAVTFDSREFIREENQILFTMKSVKNPIEITTELKTLLK